jgi:vacuolar-type H+-ATPase subunit I/STV1
MEINKKTLEKILKRFERTNPRKITMDKKQGMEPNWYSIRVDGFRLVLTQVNYQNQELKVIEKYGLELIYLHNEAKKPKVPEDERIKETYHLVKKKYDNYLQKAEKKAEKREERKDKRSLKRLDRLL